MFSMSDGLIETHGSNISISAGDWAAISISGGHVVGDVHTGRAATVEISGGVFDGQFDSITR
jgi:hypothetical protein